MKIFSWHFKFATIFTTYKSLSRNKKNYFIYLFAETCKDGAKCGDGCTCGDQCKCGGDGSNYI